MYWLRPLAFSQCWSSFQKPNKLSYDSSKTFYLIVLLNILGKLIESSRLQAHSITSGFIHPNQIGSIKQNSITDASIFLTHLIHTSWIKGLYMSTLTFNIAQFFPSLNHQLLLKILDKAGFNSRISCFFSDFLSNKQTQYVWNHFVFPFFKANIGVGQGSTLLPILFALYIASIFHIFRKRTKNILSLIQVSTLSFVDDGLLIS